MQIKDICHINISVSDLERSIAFYRDLLGCKVLMQKEIGSDNFCKAVKMGNVQAKMAMLQLNNSCTLIELFQYLHPKGENVGKYMPNAIPLGHIAFSVSDIFNVYNHLKDNDVEFFSEPQKLGDGVEFCYFRDPDGAILELIEFKDS